jgi:hypothetical protein
MRTKSRVGRQKRPIMPKEEAVRMISRFFVDDVIAREAWQTAAQGCAGAPAFRAGSDLASRRPDVSGRNIQTDVTRLELRDLQG